MDTITIYTQPQKLVIKEYNGHRVLTFKDIDTLHQRPEGTAGRNFREHKRRFIEGEDYFIIELTNDEIRRQFGAGKNAGRELILITQMGYLMLVKSFTDDLAWHIQRQLIKNYFDTRLNNTGAILGQRFDTSNTFLSSNTPSLETNFINAINQALQEGYFLYRKNARIEFDETKLLGAYDREFYYIISSRAYQIYAIKTENPIAKQSIFAYLRDLKLIKPSMHKKNFNHSTQRISIRGGNYNCLLFHSDKVKINK